MAAEATNLSKRAAFVAARELRVRIDSLTAENDLLDKRFAGNRERMSAAFRQEYDRRAEDIGELELAAAYLEGLSG